ncbi:MAG: hypothetical protein CL944_00040 [Candidatus Diapherotrites archaeon]|uniref:DUF63 family protein n=1 Tax=Candidatus Iainarchaeum sp. TaxID=3101447 RepID=A0A2D6LNU9_9ARCH|nr:hypothetical protein [Candidatus Diapherotrites archaeon]
MVQEFIQEYFCSPIINPAVQGYNFVNTSVYALILLLVIWFGIIPFLKNKDVPVNFKFMLALLPYVIFGAGFRVFNDTGIFNNTCNILDPAFFTFTPGIWFLTAGITIVALLLSKKISKDEESFYKYFGGIGLLFAVPVLLYLFSVFKSWDGFFMVVIIAAIITLAAKFVVELKEKNFFKDKLNILVVAGQVLDGSATFVATDIFSCGEQHPLSESILGVHPALFILVKIVLALLIIHYVDQDIKDERVKAFIKIAVIILGFATGGRDLLTLGAGTCL